MCKLFSDESGICGEVTGLTLISIFHVKNEKLIFKDQFEISDTDLYITFARSKFDDFASILSVKLKDSPCKQYLSDYNIIYVENQNVKKVFKILDEKISIFPHSSSDSIWKQIESWEKTRKNRNLGYPDFGGQKMSR